MSVLRRLDLELETWDSQAWARGAAETADEEEVGGKRADFLREHFYEIDLNGMDGCFDGWMNTAP